MIKKIFAGIGIALIAGSIGFFCLDYLLGHDKNVVAKVESIEYHEPYTTYVEHCSGDTKNRTCWTEPVYHPENWEVFVNTKMGRFSTTEYSKPGITNGNDVDVSIRIGKWSDRPLGISHIANQPVSWSE